MERRLILVHFDSRRMGQIDPFETLLLPHCKIILELQFKKRTVSLALETNALNEGMINATTF